MNTPFRFRNMVRNWEACISIFSTGPISSRLQSGLHRWKVFPCSRSPQCLIIYPGKFKLDPALTSHGDNHFGGLDYLHDRNKCDVKVPSSKSMSHNLHESVFFRSSIHTTLPMPGAKQTCDIAHTVQGRETDSSRAS